VAIPRIKFSQHKYYATTKVVELGYLDHFIQVVNIAVECPSLHSMKAVRRIFSKGNIEIFNNQLKDEILEDVYLQTDVNRAYELSISSTL
jgi:hypothetical protein